MFLGKVVKSFHLDWLVNSKVGTVALGGTQELCQGVLGVIFRLEKKVNRLFKYQPFFVVNL